MFCESRFIPPEMTNAAVERRLMNILETDWRAEAIAVLDERTRTGNGEVSLTLIFLSRHSL